MEVNSSISSLMREWLTEGTNRGADKCKKANSSALSANTFQPRPERLGLGATPRASIARTCTMNKIRRNINKRIRSTLMHQEGTEMIANGHMAWRPHINKDTSPDEGSRSLAFCSHVSGKTTISDEALKIHKTKRKRRRKGKYSITQDNFVTEESNPAHVLATAEESINNFCKANDLCTHKPKKWNLRLRYGIFQPQTNCTRLRWRKCIVKRIP